MRGPLSRGLKSATRLGATTFTRADKERLDLLAGPRTGAGLSQAASQTDLAAALALIEALQKRLVQAEARITALGG